MAIFFNIVKDMPLHVVSRNVEAEQRPGYLAGLVAYCGQTADMPAIKVMSSDTNGAAVCDDCVHELVRRERKAKLWPYYSSTMA